MTIEFYKGFSAITKHINWKILTKNLLLLKDWMGLRMKNYGGSLKNPFFFFFCGGSSQKRLGQFVGLRGGLTKKRGVVFLKRGKEGGQ